MLRKSGAEVEVAVYKEAAGYRIEPWKDSFVTKLPKQGAVHTYSFKADLAATKYFTLVVTDDGQPLEGASLRINDKFSARTDDNGEYVHNYKTATKRGYRLRVTKNGYQTWQKTIGVSPGERYEVSLAKKEKEVIAKAVEPPPQKGTGC